MAEPAGDHGTGSWAIGRQEPTSLFALWPRERAPERAEVLAALGRWCGGDVRMLGEEQVDDPAVLWNAVVELPGCDAPVILWTEPARAHAAAPGLDDREAQQCIWVIGAQSMLDPDRPCADLALLLRLLSGALPEIPAILDHNSTRWHQRADLAALEDAEQPAETLLLIHVVADERTDQAWLHTHGLWRCGRPELELLGVPRQLAEVGGTLLNTIAARLLEEDMPAPGLPFPVGPGLEVTFQPWRTVAPLVGGAPGGMSDRTPERGNPHAGVRAVVCPAGPPGSRREAGQCPVTVLQHLDRGDSALYMCRRDSERRAEAARAGWPAVAEAFAAVPIGLLRTDGRAPASGDPPAVRFLLKAVIAPGPPEERREHMWFIARRFDGDRAEAELLNQPVDPCGLARNDVTWIEREGLSDYLIMTPLGDFGPDDFPVIGQMIKELAAEAGGAP